MVHTKPLWANTVSSLLNNTIISELVKTYLLMLRLLTISAMSALMYDSVLDVVKLFFFIWSEVNATSDILLSALIWNGHKTKLPLYYQTTLWKLLSPKVCSSLSRFVRKWNNMYHYENFTLPMNFHVMVVIFLSPHRYLSLINNQRAL